jgi:SAM-dependent MidA family methyltransferase
MPRPRDLPEPDATAREVSEHLVSRLRAAIEAGGGFMSFSRYMEEALYAPGLGYYAAGSHKLGAGGDFTTAPETSPLFAHCLARQVAQVLEGLGGGDVLEFGAGSGAMAVDMLFAFEGLDRLPGHYLILEVSPDLRQRQQQAVAALPRALRERVCWLDRVPSAGGFRGVMLGNEVVDAMPVEIFTWSAEGVLEQGVAWGEHGLRWTTCPAGQRLRAAVQALHAECGGQWPPGYTSERNPGLGPWIGTLSDALEAGVIMLIDYGYPRQEYYSPERVQGTLMAYYRHRALDDPFLWPGLMDITAHVDFTAVAEAGEAAGLDVLGYTTQAWFLIGAGLDQAFQDSVSDDPRQRLALAGQVRQLTLPGEMGERFQVIALGRGIRTPLAGLSARDLRHRL